MCLSSVDCILQIKKKIINKRFSIWLNRLNNIPHLNRFFISGFGVDQIRDDCMETYWQSDGQLPHLVNIQFRRKTIVRDICIYIDYRLDESYTPGRISVRAGTNFNDLQEVEVVELNEPYGWVRIMTKDINDSMLKTYMLQIAVITNHQNGRDTHMRQIKVHSPVEKRDPLIGNFSTVEMRQYTIIK